MPTHKFVYDPLMVDFSAGAILRNKREFDQDVADFIVVSIADGISIHELWKGNPETIPHPIIVNRWKQERPQFKKDYEEAEAVAAEKMVWDTLAISDDKDAHPSQAKNAITTRQWLADKLNKKYEQKHGGGVHIKFEGRLTNDQLMQIAAGDVIEGELAPPKQVEHVKNGDE